jgi:response regulator NasT
MTTAPAAPIRVLLAEDDEDARHVVVELLTALGHQVVADVGSGREAVDAAREALPDVVLLDIHMPDGSGLDAATEIVRERPQTAIVLFTGDHEIELGDVQAQDTGAVAVLAKPVPPPMLDATLRMAVARARALSRAEGDAEQARVQLEHRKIIERAKGILMRRTGSSEQEAFSILRRTSQDKSRAMVDIARAVIESEKGV